MTINSLRQAAAALLLATTMLAPAGFVATPAAANDDDIICFDYSMPDGSSETECGTRGDYKVECRLVDPGNTTDFCQDVNSASIFRPTTFQSLSGPGESGGGGQGGIDLPNLPLNNK